MSTLEEFLKQHLDAVQLAEIIECADAEGVSIRGEFSLDVFEELLDLCVLSDDASLDLLLAARRYYLEDVPWLATGEPVELWDESRSTNLPQGGTLTPLDAIKIASRDAWARGIWFISNVAQTGQATGRIDEALSLIPAGFRGASVHLYHSFSRMPHTNESIECASSLEYLIGYAAARGHAVSPDRSFTGALIQWLEQINRKQDTLFELTLGIGEQNKARLDEIREQLWLQANLLDKGFDYNRDVHSLINLWAAEHSALDEQQLTEDIKQLIGSQKAFSMLSRSSLDALRFFVIVSRGARPEYARFLALALCTALEGELKAAKKRLRGEPSRDTLGSYLHTEAIRALPTELRKVCEEVNSRDRARVLRLRNRAGHADPFDEDDLKAVTRIVLGQRERSNSDAFLSRIVTL